MKNPFTYVTAFVDKTGMYRIVTIGLAAITICSLFLALVGRSAYAFSEQVISLVVAITVALALNVLLSKLRKIPANHESALITALLLFCLFTPAYVITDHYVVALVTAVAVLSKFFLAYRKQHIFNAAALGAVALSFTGWQEAWWWIAQPELFIPILFFGTLVAMKVRKVPMVATCIAAGFVVLQIEGAIAGDLTTAELQRFFLTGPILFLAFFMLTEPFTTPPTQRQQFCYAALVGALMSTSLLSSFIAMTPELALVIGNLVFYPYTLRQKLYLKYIEKKEIAKDTFEYIFEKPEGMHWHPGQYLEWMLPHKSDGRGPRRYFTIASAPEEEYVHLALRHLEEGGSSFKKALLALKPGDELIASQLAGDFKLPSDTAEKIAFVAGGIGITPFRAYLGRMFAGAESRDIVLFYANNVESDIAYMNELKRAETEHGLHWVNVVAKEEVPNCEYGYLTREIIERQTPDYKERIWYLSGPPGMVGAYSTLLRECGVPQSRIHTDFFPGLA